MKRPEFLKSAIKTENFFFHTRLFFPFVNHCAVSAVEFPAMISAVNGNQNDFGLKEKLK